VKNTKIIMGMPITIEISDDAKSNDLHKIFKYFNQIDEQYSPYKPSSELSKVNAGLPRDQWSQEFLEIMELCEQTKQQTNGYFDIEHNGTLDPSGLVKGWAIQRAAEQLLAAGFKNFYLEAGGDIQVHGNYKADTPWQIGIRNPFNIHEIVKVVNVHDQGVATSGTYIRGEHIYDPHHNFSEAHTIKSLTVIGPNIYEADRFATAAFAMGEIGIAFIQTLPNFEGYMINDARIATYTPGFEKYVAATH
jgi:thiamine biosynthesis lipoprotein